MCNISIVSPGAGSTVSGSVVWQAQVVPNGQIVRRVEFFLDGLLVNTQYTAPYFYTDSRGNQLFNTMSLTNGNHTLRCTAYDQSDRTYVAQITVAVANQVGVLTRDVVVRVDERYAGLKFVSVLAVPYVKIDRAGDVESSWTNCFVYVTEDRTVASPQWVNITASSLSGAYYTLSQPILSERLGFKFVPFLTVTGDKLQFDGYGLQFRTE